MPTVCLMVKLPQGLQILELTEGYPLFIGRSVECDIHLPSPAVSKRHAVVLARSGEVGLKDLESTNGTFLNGKRVNRPLRLKLGDVIKIGPFSIEYNDRLVLGKGREGTALPQIQAATRPETPTEAALPTGGGQGVSAKRTSAYPPAADTGNEIPTGEYSGVADAPIAQALGNLPRPRHNTSIRYATPVIGPDNVHRSDEIDEDMTDAEEEALAEERATLEREERERQAEEEALREARRKEHEERAKQQAAAKPPPAPVPPPAIKKAAAPSPGKPGKAAGLKPVPRIALPTRLNVLPDRYADSAVLAGVSGGSGASDGAFAVVEVQVEEEDRELALAKAAAEAGLVGEFVPEVEPPPPGQAGRPEGEEEPEADLGQPFKPPPNSVPIDNHFRRAIDARLTLYSLCARLKEERAAILAGQTDLPDAVKAEYDRQDRETDKIPDADRAADMIQKRLDRRKDLQERIKAARASGEAPPPLPSTQMVEAENMAINQWTLFVDSQRLALEAAVDAGWRLGQREPLAEMLGAENIDTRLMLGGGIYLLALGVMAEEAAHKRAQVRARLNQIEATAKKSGGGRSGFSLFSRGGGDEEEEEAPANQNRMSEGELRDREKALAIRVSGINQEILYIETMLIKEFWDVYEKACLVFLANIEDMELPIRAFIRYGVIGFAQWWLKPEVREHVIGDCTHDVKPHLEVAKDLTNVVYADEYLAAVMNRECTPAMDENLEINERNSPNWRADKALRKLINAKSQQRLLNEMMESLAQKIEALETQEAEIAEKLKEIDPSSKTAKQEKTELTQNRQAVRVELTKLTSLRTKITGHTMAILAETIQETEDRFSSGELPNPTAEFLISRECGQIRKIGRLLANLKERFMPMVMRESFQVNTDAVNDRASILRELADIERRDPGVFLEVLVPSKKKANRVDLRISPVIVIIPASGLLAFSWNPRSRPEDGRMALPTCFIRQRLRERQLTYLISDFRWDTSKMSAGMDVMNSETIVAAFMSVRWDWRKRSKEGREKGLVYTDQNDRTNWRRVYEAYLQTADDAGKKLYNRNYDFYERIIGKYFDMPEGVDLLKK